MEIGFLPNTFSFSSRLGSNNTLLFVPGRKGSPMTSFDAETDLKPIVTITIQYSIACYVKNKSFFAIFNRDAYLMQFMLCPLHIGCSVPKKKVIYICYNNFIFVIIPVL